VKIGPVVSAEYILVEIACVFTSWFRVAYFVKYLQMYWTDFHNLFTI